MHVWELRQWCFRLFSDSLDVFLPGFVGIPMNSPTSSSDGPVSVEVEGGILQQEQFLVGSLD